jgi:hypothetical protein
MLLIMGGMLMAAMYFVGCAGKTSYEDSPDGYYKEKVTAEEQKEVNDAVPTTAGEGYTEETKDAQNAYAPPPPPPSGTVDNEQIPSKIIKSADISFQVEKYDESRKAILDIAKKFGARVSSENQVNDGYSISNTMMIRVEGTSFDSLVDALMTESIYIDYKNINAQDVTEEYVDLTARLKSKKDLEARYTEILKKANSVDEILEVQEYLGRIREEIESFEGRLKYMDDRVAYSTITLKFYEKLDNVSKQPDRTFGSRMEEAFGTGWNGLVSFFLGLIYLWPAWLILGFSAWLIVFLIKRGNRRRKAAREAKLKA